MADTPYAILLSSDSSGVSDANLDLPGDLDVTDVAEALDALFGMHPGPKVATLVVDGEQVGLCRRDELIGIHRGVSDADGAVLPGRSFRYQLVRLECPHCDHSAIRIHVDYRDPPDCPNGHGPLRPSVR